MGYMNLTRKEFVAVAAITLSSVLIIKISPSAQDANSLRWWLGSLRVVVVHTV